MNIRSLPARVKGALLIVLGLCLAAATIAIVSLVDGLPVHDPKSPLVLGRGRFPRYYGGRNPTILWAVVAVPVFVAVTGLIQLVLGRPFRDLPDAWNALSGCTQRIIVYGLLILIPALIIWLAATFS